jgi:hypothetical protein
MQQGFLLSFQVTFIIITRVITGHDKALQVHMPIAVSESGEGNGLLNSSHFTCPAWF